LDGKIDTSREVKGPAVPLEESPLRNYEFAADNAVGSLDRKHTTGEY
jgi:hypothetical protein